VTLLASIPSPSSGELVVGPLTLHAYGFMLLLGITAAVLLTGVRWTRRGGDWDLVLRASMWGVVGGIIGARLYHVVTSWSEIADPKWKGVFEIWNGGLGIWGAVFGGAIAAAIVVHRSGESVWAFFDAGAPGVLLAQAIGRWGNWFNQELFGKPTDLPWGLEIDTLKATAVGYLGTDTFHPLFLYESLWCLLGVGVLLLVDRRFDIKPPGIFCLYVAWYTLGRVFFEQLRVDPAHEYFGLRLNSYVAAALFVLALIGFVWSQRRGGERKPRRRKRDKPTPRKPLKTMAIPKGRVRPRR
jgi:prolipoprotein diacylglyceryl transferase